MKKLKRDNLTDLIQSLSVNERRYFKLYSSLSPHTNYKKLFALLDSGKEMSNEAIKKKLANTNMNVSYEKKYLQKILLRSMRNYFEDSTIEATLHKMQIEIDHLFNKELFSFCYMHIEEAMEIATNYELFTHQLQLLKWKRSCVVRLGNTEIRDRFSGEEAVLEQQCIERLANLAGYKALQQKIFLLLTQKGTALKEEDKRMAQEILDDPRMKDISLALSMQARVHFLEVKIWCYHCLHNLNAAFKYSGQLVRLFDENSRFIKLAPHGYLSALATYYNRSYLLGKFAEADMALNKAEGMLALKDVAANHNLRCEIFYLSSERKLMQYAYAGEFTKAVEQFEKNKYTWTRNKMKLRTSYYLLQYYFAALSHFYLRQYDIALKYLRKIVDEFDDKTRLDFVLFARVLHLLTQFELGNHDLLPYISKSLQRFMKSRKIERESAELIIKLLRTLARHSGDKKATARMMKLFKADLDKLEHNADDRILNGTLMLKRWIDLRQI
ncbi:MAG TPA: hypothetical protein VK174_13660 [Chitinophagales bacterium]|nr:hypothetical protein [Chitinophagales bacterium]